MKASSIFQVGQACWNHREHETHAFFGLLVTLVKLHGSFPTFVFIFSRNICRENGRKCIAGTYVAVQPGAYAPCYGDAHRRVTQPLWLKIGKLAASELCEYFVFSGIRAFTRELSATPFRIPILSSRISGEKAGKVSATNFSNW